jgi:hypothetical protein
MAEEEFSGGEEEALADGVGGGVGGLLEDVEGFEVGAEGVGGIGEASGGEGIADKQVGELVMVDRFGRGVEGKEGEAESEGQDEGEGGDGDPMAGEGVPAGEEAVAPGAMAEKEEGCEGGQQCGGEFEGLAGGEGLAEDRRDSLVHGDGGRSGWERDWRSAKDSPEISV